MKKLLLFCFLFIGQISFAQKPTENALLWEITGNKLAKPSYLFGTIHMLCATDFELSSLVQQKLKESEQLALEVDMDDPKMMVTMMQHMNMTDGSTIKSLLSAEEFQKLAVFYKDSLGFDIAMFQNAKPLLLMAPMLSGILGCEPKSFETELANMIASDKKELIGLETIEEQMAVFDSISYSEQAEMLMELFENKPKARQEFEDMLQLYKSEDIDKLLEIGKESTFAMDAQEKILLQDRNEKWIPRMTKSMLGKATFFAVGAAHLGGDFGVIALLRQVGYQVVPVVR